MENITEIERKIISAQKELDELDARRSAVLERIKQLKEERDFITKASAPSSHRKIRVTNQSSEAEKISLFRSLFRGREDVYPRRFESRRTGKTGYQPACGNEWIKGVCKKPKIKCSDCDNRELLPLTDEVIRNHLLGMEPERRSKDAFTIGIYPLLADETCWFIAIDFDKRSWMDDSRAFLETCKAHNVPSYLERSRSGNGGHVWIFFSKPLEAALARKMTSFLLTETMERRPEIGLDSYDRLFPNQDRMPKGGFGNLIALPLQKRPRERGNSVFLNKDLAPYLDQWAFLSQVRRMNRNEVEAIVCKAERQGRVIGVRETTADEACNEPWTMPPSGRRKEPPIVGPMPDHIELVLGNQIYIEKRGLPPALLNRFVRLAAFQNPEFYKSQAMRLSTYNKPRIISCCEDFPNHIGLPRGCLDGILDLLNDVRIDPIIIDKRIPGNPISLDFQGILRPEQKEAAISMLSHDIGVLSATTAFGKTVAAAYLIAERGVNTLILVHRRQLLDQWVNHLNTFLGLDPKDIGQIGGGKRKPSGIVDVALIQSLNRKGEVDDIVGMYGHLVVDECHHISARSFEMVARQCKAKYITGLSATVIRKDGHHPIIFMQCGPVRHRVDERKQAAARPFEHKVIVRKTGFTFDKDTDFDNLPIHKVYAALANDDNRNNMIIDDVISALERKRSPIVLTERKEHLVLLKERLSHFVKHLIVLKGGIRQKERQQIAEEMKSIPEDEERLIIATGRYLGEGFDDARLDTLFIALPVSWRGTLAQYAGRLNRLHDMKKEVVIYDYVDPKVPVLAKMYKRRLAGYKAIGYEIKE
ncbi:MAG: TOTE conflict system archaeo-eukaryotic primase domain-containing protein [Thermodesulfobacteriota bacterium]